jgi:DNA-binding response OmpR family regulator
MKSAPVVLLAEDMKLVGDLVSECLADEGFRVAGPFETSSVAINWLVNHTPDVAILDLYLKDGASTPLARELSVRKIPFFVFSGSPRASCNVFEFAGATWLEKPDSLGHLIATIDRLAGTHAN